MTPEFPPPAGTVAYAPLEGGPFRTRKYRPVVFLNDTGWAIPLTSTGRVHTWIEPTDTNGLDWTSGVITDIRVLVHPSAHFCPVGRMSAAELAVIKQASRYGYVLIVPVK